MAVRIPLFPLEVVLFPHMRLGLHIFEDRYRAMMRDCREVGQTFGIVAIREGSEVGGGMVPYTVGTLAQFHDVEEFDDGRFRLTVSGASRFRIEELAGGRPYLTARVRYLEDLPGEDEDLDRVLERVAASFRGYAAALDQLSGREDEDGELEVPEDPELLSYTVAASLQVELPVRQELLEIDSASVRLRRCLALLRREAAVLEAMLSHRGAQLGAFSPN